MGFGFRKSFKIAPGVRLNVSKKGVGASIGVKGLRYSVNSRGQRRKTVGIPGTGVYYTTTSSGRRYKTGAYKRQQELKRRQREAEKLQELERNRLEVELFKNKLEMMKSIHKECDDEWNWSEIKEMPPPFLKGEKGSKEKEAFQRLETYKPNFFSKLFKLDEKKQNELRNRIEKAKEEDKEDYEEWEKLVRLADRVTKGEADAYFEVIQNLAPLDDLSEFGSGFEFFVEEPHYMEIEFDVQTENVIPAEVKSLTKTGKISVKRMAKTNYYDLQQDYVCSCVLRIARDMFATLPLDHVYIHALEERINTATGHNEKVVILSVKLERTALNALNFDRIDCSDSMTNFKHNIKFRKTKGFDRVEKVSSNS